MQSHRSRQSIELVMRFAIAIVVLLLAHDIHLAMAAPGATDDPDHNRVTVEECRVVDGHVQSFNLVPSPPCAAIAVVPLWWSSTAIEKVAPIFHFADASVHRIALQVFLN